MTPTTRRRRVGLLATGALLASTVGLAAVSAPVGALRPDPSGPPAPVTDLVPTACNNTFSPAKFPLTWQVTSTVTSPLNGSNATTIAPGDPFNVQFDVTANLAASFKVSAYLQIGPQPLSISEARATIAPLSGATGAVVSVGTGVTGGFTSIPVAAPGRAVTGVTTVDQSATITGPANNTFSAADVGAYVYDTTNFGNLGQIISVGANGDTATLDAVVNGGGVINIQVWNPADVTDTPVPIGTVTGSYQANAGANTKATFQLLGNSTYAGNGSTIPADTPVGFSVNASDPRGGTVIANSTAGFAGSVSNGGKNTYVRAALTPQVQPYLLCMGGTWSAGAPVPPNTTQSYGYPYNSPGGQTSGTIGNAGKSTGRLGIPVSTNGSATLTGAAGSFSATDVGSPVTGSLGLPDSQAVNTGIPDGAKITAVGAGGSTATMSAPATKTGGTAVDIVGGFAAVDITPPPIPTATISSISGQAVTNAARDGNVISFGGPNWTPNLTTGITAELCDSGGANCDPAGLTSVSASTSSLGVLTGTATVTSTATVGTGRTLKISEPSPSTKTDFSATLTVLGTPTLACSPSCSGPANGSVNVTGTNWNPGQVTKVAALDGSLVPIAATVVDAVIDSTGGLTGTVTTPTGTTYVAAQNFELPAPPAPGSLFAFLPFSLNQNSQNCGNPLDPSTGLPLPLTGCALQQNLTLNVQAGNFTWSQQTPFIVLNSTTTGGGCTEANKDTCFGLVLNGKNQVATGALNEVTIIDARGQNAPWSVTAVMGDLVTGAGGTNKFIPAGNMTLTPACAVVDGGPPLGAAVVQQGPAAPLSNTVPIPVCSALANQGGGTFTLNGGLSLQVPASQAAGKYTSTITLTAV